MGIGNQSALQIDHLMATIENGRSEIMSALVRDIKNHLNKCKTLGDFDTLISTTDRLASGSSKEGDKFYAANVRLIRDVLIESHTQMLSDVIKNNEGEEKVKKFLDIAARRMAMIKFRDLMCDLLSIDTYSGVSTLTESLGNFSVLIKNYDPAELWTKLREMNSNLLEMLISYQPETAAKFREFLRKEIIEAGSESRTAYENLSEHLKKFVTEGDGS